MRVIQGAILVALVAIAGLLYSIRKEMTEPLAPPVQTEQTVPAPQGLVASTPRLPSHL